MVFLYPRLSAIGLILFGQPGALLRYVTIYVCKYHVLTIKQLIQTQASLYEVEDESKISPESLAMKLRGPMTSLVLVPRMSVNQKNAVHVSLRFVIEP